jgi:hypothetical protein
MTRTPSPKQRFIKDYARLVYGPAAKSNALTKKDRAVIKQLFCYYGASGYVLENYPNWIAENWTAIQRDLQRGSLRADISRPGIYLLAGHTVADYLPYAYRGRRFPAF